jgi:DNA-binding MarR family transcriptional regulator
MRVGKSRWDEVGYIISSRYRVLVLERLIESPATPSRIASDSNSSITHVSRALQQLRERSHVELLVSEDRKKGRVYGITDEGRSVWETVNTKNMV